MFFIRDGWNFVNDLLLWLPIFCLFLPLVITFLISSGAPSGKVVSLGIGLFMICMGLGLSDVASHIMFEVHNSNVGQSLILCGLMGIGFSLGIIIFGVQDYHALGSFFQMEE